MKKKLKGLVTKLNKLTKKAFNSVTKLLLSRLPKAVGTPLAILLVLAPVGLSVSTYLLSKGEHPSAYTVMVTSMDGRSGGSGVVIQNSPSESKVLSNRHVCEVLKKNNGIITMVNGAQHLITGYVNSSQHDLCVLTVAADLDNSIEISSKSPELYTDAVVTGHPALMPNVITTGHFGGRKMITLMTGIRKCKPSDMKDPLLGPFCAFFGMAPILATYESQVVTATIMGGSSGSAVLNSDGELSGLVFAGNAKGLSYAFVVPQEAIVNFIRTEATQIDTISSRLIPGKAKEEEREEEEEFSANGREAISVIKSKFEEKCKDSNSLDLIGKQACSQAEGLIEESVLF